MLLNFALFIGPIRLAILVTAAVVLLIAFAFVLAIPEGRKTLQKFFYLTKNLFGIDMGLGGFLRLVLFSLLTALGAALAKGFGASGFDWHVFVYVFIALIAVNLLNNVLGTSASIRDFFSPKSGRKWLAQRKSTQAGIIKKININIPMGNTVSDEQIKGILTDLLDIIVLHVRDYRGSHQDKKKEVFASLLIERGDDLVVVARDSLSHSSEYERRIPAIYPKAAMLCGRAMVAKKALSIGKLLAEYPEAPKNKPYSSILAIPLFSSDGDDAFGCVSIDCSKPYFFQSFTPDQVENDMENSLQPYLQLITMAIECFVGRDRNQLRDGVINRIAR